MANNKIFSLEGKGLKLDTAEDIEPHIKDLKNNEDVEEIRLLGNTFGIGASEALAKVLETKKKLQVCLAFVVLFGGVADGLQVAIDLSGCFHAAIDCF